jgi:hypothetical protein
MPSIYETVNSDYENMRLMKASMPTGLILSIASTLAILLILANMTNSLGSAAFAQGNQSQPQQQSQQQNQTGGGQGGQQQQQQNDTGIGTAQELGNLTGLSNETIARGTDIESPNATTMGGLEQEQTSTETTSAGQQNQTQQQQQNQTQQQQQNQTAGNQTGGQNQTQKGPLEQLGETLGGIFGGGGGN